MATLTPSALAPSVVFYFLAALLCVAVLFVVRSRNIFHSALGLTGALSIVAGVFAFLGADFVAASQLLVYVGGVMVLMLFVIILFQQSAQPGTLEQASEGWLWGLIVAGALVALLFEAFGGEFAGVAASSSPAPTTAALGRLLVSDLQVPFEVVSLVLVAALVGAVIFGSDRREDAS